MKCCTSDCNQGRDCPYRASVFKQSSGGQSVSKGNVLQTYRSWRDILTDRLFNAVWWIGTIALVLTVIAAAGFAFGFWGR